MVFYLVSVIPDYVKFIIKTTSSITNPPIHIYINRINNRLVFKIKYEYQLELHKNTRNLEIIG